MARPWQFEEAATKSIRVRVTPRQLRALDQVVKDNRTNRSGVIRQAVDEYVADYSESVRVFRSTKR